MARRIRATGALAPLVLLCAPASAEDAKPVVVEAGRTVSIEYTLRFDDGTDPETNAGGEPLVYHAGGNEILPALEDALAGMKVGDSRKVTLTAAQGYGEVDPRLFQEVAVAEIPEDARVVGTELVAEDGAGNQRSVRVREVREDKIVMDLNHPLAGKTLHFEVKILKIE